MSNICIITARGGSKRIPRKNIRDFLGKPIIAYSIEAAIKSCLFDEVMVSTDDEEIKLISEKYGAKVPFMRTSINSNDYSTTVDVLAEVLNKYSELGKFFNTVCCLYPTAPFVTSSVLLQAYKMLTENTFDCVFPVIQYSFPIQRALRLSGKNNINIEMFYPEYLKSRSQDLEKSYHDCGQYYFFKPEIVLKKNKLYTNNTGAIIIDEFHSQDIDNEIDWKLAEVKFKLLNGQA